MRYNSITTFLHDADPGEGALNVLGFAIDAARKWDAHLHVVCIGVDATDPGYYYAGAQAIAVQQNLELAQDEAATLQDKAEARLKREDIRWDVETVTVMANGLSPFLANHMRFHDLAILPLPYAPNCDQTDVAAFEACLFGADIPVLVVPTGRDMSLDTSRVLIAWDDGAEAMAATKAARPLIQSAKKTEICLIDPPGRGPDRSDPGGRLAQMLARSGATIEITVAARLRNSIAEQLLQHATETGAGVIVMGGYGHSRLREAVLGGVTRSMLRDSTVPVLMAR